MTHASLVLHDLSVGYYRPGEDALSVVNHVDETLHGGEFVCLIGPNGAGKSTLLRTIAGMQPALAGRVTLMGQDLHHMRADERARHLSVVLTQKMDVGLFTGYALVALGRQPYTGWLGTLSPKDHHVVQRAIYQVGADDLANCRFNEMSDGERQKILIARALAQEPDVMILDEPTAYLDLPRRVETMNLLRNLAHDSGCTVLVSTHELDLALRWADRIWLLPYGGAMQVGIPEDLVLNGAFEGAFQSEGVKFDRTTGTFGMGRQVSTRTVVLHGDGTHYFWTRRALERAGFHVETGQRPGLPVVHVGSTREPVWWLHDGNQEVQCTSIDQIIGKLNASAAEAARTPAAI